MVRSLSSALWQRRAILERSPTLPTGPTLPLFDSGLVVRSLLREDLDRRQAWTPYNDPLRLIWDMPHCSKRENDGWFSQINDGQRRLAYAIDDQEGQLIGMLSLRDIDWGHCARLGITLGSPYAGQGRGTAALHLFLPYFFLTLRFPLMVLDVAAANVRALRCYQRLGFRCTGSHWRMLDNSLDPRILDQPAYAALRHLFRWSLGRVEALHYDMEMWRDEWERADGGS